MLRAGRDDAEGDAATTDSATRQAGARCPRDAEIVIVGGGVMGLSIAYHLARARARRDVVVLERGYLAEGASGRNGGGVRQQWSTEMNIRLMQESIELCRALRQRARRQRLVPPGRLPVPRAQREAEVARLEKNVALQNRCGVPTRMLAPDGGAGASSPSSTSSGIVGACVQPDRRHRVPVAVPVGLRARRRAARGVAHLHVRRRSPAIERRARRRLHRARRRAGTFARRAGRSTPPARGRPRSRAWSASTLPNLAASATRSARPSRSSRSSAAGLGARERPLLLAVDARRDRRRHHALPEHDGGDRTRWARALAFLATLRARAGAS